jgi:hypothetical protein
MGIGHSKHTKDPRYRGVGSEDARRRERERYQFMAGASLRKEPTTTTTSSRRSKKSQKVIKGLDKSMIGSPMNFKHVGHIGVSDLKVDQINTNAFTLYRADVESTTLPHHQHETTVNTMPTEPSSSSIGATHLPIILQDDREATKNPPVHILDPSPPLPESEIIQKELPHPIAPKSHIFQFALGGSIEDFLMGEEGILPSRCLIRSDDTNA